MFGAEDFHGDDRPRIFLGRDRAEVMDRPCGTAARGHPVGNPYQLGPNQYHSDSVRSIPIRIRASVDSRLEWIPDDPNGSPTPLAFQIFLGMPVSPSASE